MDPERWQVVQDLFDQALEHDPVDRAAFLRKEAAGDLDLVQEVESLLASDAAAGDVLDDALSDGLELFFDGEAEAPASGRFGKYDVLEQIGQGGFGTVYRGHDPQLQRTVAIKTCTARDPSVRQRFVREARLAANLSHPNIITVHDFGEENGLPYLVQELLDGEDLDRRIERRESVPLATAQSYLLQIAQGLAYAHDQKVLHRDIKPENIRVLPGDRIKILDFGIACLVTEQRRLTGEHRTIGTVGYMAPEQLRGHDLDERSDIFAFGVLAYQLLGLERPFDGRAFADISHRILHEEPKPLRLLRASVPESLADLVRRCLAKEPGDRPASFRQVADELAEMDGHPSVGASHVRWPIWMAAGSAAVAAAALWSLLVLSLPERSSDSQEPTQESTVAAGASVERPQDSPMNLGGDEPKVLQPELSLAEAGPEDSPPPPPLARVREPQTTPPPPATQAGSLVRQAGGGGDPATALLEPSPQAEDASQESPPGESSSVAPSESVAAPTAPIAEDPPNLDESTLPTFPSDPATPGSLLATQPMEGPPEPILVRRVEPAYPALARRRGVEGEVRVAILVDTSGGIQQTAVTYSSVLDLGFEEAALEAARKATFQPAEMGGKAVQAWIELTYTFRLR